MRDNRLAAIIVMISVIAACAAVLAPRAAAMVLIAGEDVPVPPVAAFVLADVTGDGRAELVTVGEHGVHVLAPGDDPVAESAWMELMSLPPLPSPATAVAVGDFIGDGVPAVAVGTGGAGAIYLLRWTGIDWTIVTQTGYLWAPISRLMAADLSGDGQAELIAFDASGGITVFRWQRRTLEPVWQWESAMGRPLHVDVASITEDDSRQLVVADDQGRISVWQWPLTSPAAQAIVWGTPAALAVADVTGTRPEIIVTTDQRLLYRYVWDDAHLIPAAPPLHDTRLPFDWMIPMRWSGHSADRLLAHNPTGIGLWRVSGSSISLVDEGWADMPFAAAQWPEADVFVMGERGGALRLWTRKPADYFRVTIDNKPFVLRDPPLFQQNQVMLSARDWADAFGLQLFWQASKQRLTVLGRRTYAIFTVGERLVMLPRGVHRASIPPLVQEGRTYVPPEFPTWFGATYQWDPRRRALHVTTTD